MQIAMAEISTLSTHPFNLRESFSSALRYSVQELLGDLSASTESIDIITQPITLCAQLSHEWRRLFRSGLCGIHTFTVLLILFHKRAINCGITEQFLYDISVLIYSALCRVKHAQNDSTPSTSNQMHRHFINYFTNAYVDVEYDLSITTTHSFHRMVCMMDFQTATEVISSLYADGKCSHEIIIKVLLIGHMSLTREKIDKVAFMRIFAQILYAACI